MLAGIVFGVGMAIGAREFPRLAFSITAQHRFQGALMSKPPEFHPVYRSINKSLTIWGAERRLFFLAAIIGAATWNISILMA
jgi:hypothetical protein